MKSRATAITLGLIGAMILTLIPARAFAKPAFIVSQVTVFDPGKFAEYAQKAAETAAAYGGIYLVRGGNPEAIEGSLQHSRVVIIKFPTREQALRWHSSSEYQAIAPIRRQSATAIAFIVDGLEP